MKSFLFSSATLQGGYEPAGPPPPPQRTASYLQTQAFSPDALYTAKFVAYNEEEDEDDEPAGQDRPSGRRARPVSDGIFLAGPFRPPPPGASRTEPGAGLQDVLKKRGFIKQHARGIQRRLNCHRVGLLLPSSESFFSQHQGLF